VPKLVVASAVGTLDVSKCKYFASASAVEEIAKFVLASATVTSLKLFATLTNAVSAKPLSVVASVPAAIVMSSTFWVIVTLDPAVKLLNLKSGAFLSLKTLAPEPVVIPPVISPLPTPVDETVISSVVAEILQVIYP